MNLKCISYIDAFLPRNIRETKLNRKLSGKAQKKKADETIEFQHILYSDL